MCSNGLANKLLTISIAAYNVEKYIGKAIESCILSKEARNYIELIVINDGSNDNTSKIAHMYQERFPQIITVIDKENGGYGSTINFSLNNAHGKYFKLLDGDDWLITKDLEKFVMGLQNCEEDMVLTNYLFYYGEKSKIARIKLPIQSSVKINDIYWKTNFQMHSIAYKTCILKDKKIKISENCFYTDIEFVILPLSVVKTVCYFDLVVYAYRLNLPTQSVSIKGIKRHYRDSQNVLYRLLNEVSMSDSFLYKYQIALFAKKVIVNFLIGDSFTTIRKNVERIDLDILEADKDIYKLMENKTMRYLRRSNYLLSSMAKILYLVMNK